jgi:hypothetical protein
VYTRRVIGEETLSRTRAFSLRQSAARSATTNSFIWSSLMGHIGSHFEIFSYSGLTSTLKRLRNR